MLLAIDSASRILSLALYDGETLPAEMTWATANNHSVELAPAIAHVLHLAGIGQSALTALAVSVGPGSFNGLRIGVSVAKGLALARNLPLIGIRTLDIVATAQPGLPDGLLLAAVTAGRGRVAVCTYRWHGAAWRSDENTHIADWAGVLAALPPTSGPICAAGEIDAAGRVALSGAGIQVLSMAQSLRRAGYLAQLGWAAWKAGAEGNPDALQPFYLHQPGVPHP